MFVDAKGEAAQSPGPPVIVPTDPPDFTKCIAQVKADPGAGQEPDTKIRTACQSAFNSYSQPVMGFLITGYWYQGTAHKLGIKLTDAQLQQAITKAKKQSRSDAAAYKQFLATSGYTAETSPSGSGSRDLQKLLKRHPTAVTDAQIATTTTHKSSYGSAREAQPADGPDQDTGQRQGGQGGAAEWPGWDAVAKKYSIDPNSKNSGGLLTGVTAQQDAALTKAAFSAPLTSLRARSRASSATTCSRS